MNTILSEEMTFTTAGLADRFDSEVEAAEPILPSFGGLTRFYGAIITLDIYEDSGLIQEILREPGEGKVLVVDGGGSVQRALVGQELAQLGKDNGWQGMIIYGCVRHAARLAEIAIGIRALASSPLPPSEHGRGSGHKPVHFAGITFREGQYVYVDEDGILIAPRDLVEFTTENTERTEG
ncbi:MAG: ribonuclease E activity regulator RraA [Chloroflexota bacterium]